MGWRSLHIYSEGEKRERERGRGSGGRKIRLSYELEISGLLVEWREREKEIAGYPCMKKEGRKETAALMWATVVLGGQEFPTFFLVGNFHFHHKSGASFWC